MHKYVPSNIDSISEYTLAARDDLIYSTVKIQCKCGSEAFLLYHNGLEGKMVWQKHGILEAREDFPLIVSAICTVCAKKQILFDSETNGYDNCVNAAISLYDCSEKNLPSNSIQCKCPKCNHREVTIHNEYEYPAIEELEDLAFDDSTNAYTWIKIKRTCVHCSDHSTIVDWETG